MRPHIALNAQLLSLSQSYRGAGISWYITNILNNLGPAAPDFQFTAFLSDWAFQNTTLNLQFSRWPTHRPAVRILWEQVVQPVALRRLRPDLLHALAFVAPLITPCPFIITVYDLSFLRYPAAFRPVNRWYLQQFTAWSVNRAEAVIAISESTRQDVINLLGKPATQVHTVYCGADENFRPLPSAEIAAFKTRLGLPETFLLFVGTLEPRKNVEGLIRAYAIWRQQDPAAPPLVIAGGQGWYYQEIFALVETLNLQSHVHFPGYVPQNDLPLWYNAATMFVYPSHFEGFGLPVLEAMACGTPVITSTTSSLPEVAGEAGLLVNPAEPAALAEACQRVMAEADLRAEMRQQGLSRAAQFQWPKAAQETIEVYRTVLRN